MHTSRGYGSTCAFSTSTAGQASMKTSTTNLADFPFLMRQAIGLNMDLSVLVSVEDCDSATQR